MKRIDKKAFYGCMKLNEIEIPASVEILGEGCFMNCLALSRVTFSAGIVLNHVQKCAFKGCRGLKQIEIPASVEVLSEECFFVCSSLSRVTFENGNNLKQIEKDAFGICPSLKQIEIPVLTVVAPVILYDSGVTIVRTNVSWTNPLRRGDINSKLEQVMIPASVDILCESCFMGCESLSCVRFGSGSVLKSIGYRAFKNCKCLKRSKFLQLLKL